jgi:hypothetical protein
LCGISGRKPNADIARDVDQPFLKEMIFDAIRKWGDGPLGPSPQERARVMYPTNTLTAA